MINDKSMKERMKVFEKLISTGYDTDKKIMDMKIEELLLKNNFSRSDLCIAVGIKQALISRTLITYLCDSPSNTDKNNR